MMTTHFDNPMEQLTQSSIQNFQIGLARGLPNPVWPDLFLNDCDETHLGFAELKWGRTRDGHGIPRADL
jgi:hypothetical protein